MENIGFKLRLRFSKHEEGKQWEKRKFQISGTSCQLALGETQRGKQGLWRGHGLIPPGGLSASECPWHVLFAYILCHFCLFMKILLSINYMLKSEQITGVELDELLHSDLPMWPPPKLSYSTQAAPQKLLNYPCHALPFLNITISLSSSPQIDFNCVFCFGNGCCFWFLSSNVMFVPGAVLSLSTLLCQITSCEYTPIYPILLMDLWVVNIYIHTYTH